MSETKTVFKLTEEQMAIALVYAKAEGYGTQEVEGDNSCKDLDSSCGFDTAISSVLPEHLAEAWIAFVAEHEDEDDFQEREAFDEDQFSDLMTAWNAGCDEALEEHEKTIDKELQEAGEEGYRVCVFGLPGSSTHAWDLAEPGKADEVMDSLWNPGPIGPYDSCIMTPLEAAQCQYRDGTYVYGRTWSDIQAKAAE